jgi:hypothetical protein
MNHYHRKQHHIWQLRHEACKKCHGERDGKRGFDYCICGPEPCRNCGVIDPNSSLSDKGCDRCIKPDYPKTIDTENAGYLMVVECPYCKEDNTIDGDGTMFGAYASVLICHKCNKKAWIGIDTSFDYGEDIESEDAPTEVGGVLKCK